MRGFIYFPIELSTFLLLFLANQIVVGRKSFVGEAKKRLDGWKL